MKVLRPDGKVIESTEKAYNTLYAPLGYKPYVEQTEPDKEPEVPEKQVEKPVTKRKAGGKK